jgi:hypothetical protein
MRLELAERLRCPGAHAPTPLIVVAQETRARVLHRAIVGCAVCGLEARIASGALTFPNGLALTGAGAGGDADASTLERLVALLHLDAPGGAVLLAGGYARYAVALEAAHDVHVVVLDPSRDDGRAARSIPFTDATFRAAAVDALPAWLLDDLTRVVTPGGRIVAPAGSEPPSGARLLARDDQEWVAASEGGGGGMVELKRMKAER